MQEFLQIVDINLFLATILAMLSNIVLGSIDSAINKHFDKVKLFKGTVKALMVISALFLLTFTGFLVPDVKVLDQLTIPEAMNLFTTAALIWYAAQGLLKIKDIVLPSNGGVIVNTDYTVNTTTVTDKGDTVTEVAKVEETNITNIDK